MIALDVNDQDRKFSPRPSPRRAAAEALDVPACIGALHWFAGGAAAARKLGKAVAEAGARAGADVRELRAAVAAADLLIWPYVLQHGASCSHVGVVSDCVCTDHA